MVKLFGMVRGLTDQARDREYAAGDQAGEYGKASVTVLVKTVILLVRPRANMLRVRSDKYKMQGITCVVLQRTQWIEQRNRGRKPTRNWES